MQSKFKESLVIVKHRMRPKNVLKRRSHSADVFVPFSVNFHHIVKGLNK